MIKRVNRLRIFFVVFFCLFYGQSLYAQKKYSDFLTSTHDGANLEIQRHYILNRKDTILVDQYDALLFGYKPDSISFVSRVTLNYVAGKPDGDYFSEQTTFSNSDVHPSYRNFRVLQSIRGEAAYTYGKYRQGLPAGTWNQYKVFIDDRNLDTVEMASFRFDTRGNRTGQFEWRDLKNLSRLIGEFKDNLPVGTWEYNQRDAAGKFQKIEFLFEEGRLVQISSGKLVKRVGQFKFDTQNRYLLHEVFETYLRKNRTNQGDVDSLIFTMGRITVGHVNQISPRTIPIHLSGFSHNALYPEIALPLFPIDAETRKFLTRIVSSVDSLKSQASKLMNNPDIVLSAYGNKELAVYLARVSLLHNRLMDVKGIWETMNSPLLQHLDWEELLRNGYLRMAQREKIRFDAVNQTFDLNEPLRVFNEQQSVRENWEELINLFQQTLTKATEEIERLVIAREKNEQLEELKAKMLLYSKQIDSVMLQTDFPDLKFVQDYKNGFTQFRNLLIERFNALPESEKLEKGSDLVVQYERLAALANQSSTWVRTHEFIDAKYHYLYLDPNTFVERIELLYERLFTAYIGKLMPFVMGELNFKFNHVDEFEKTFQNIQLLQQRMIDLLDENPRTINRRIKRGDSPSKVLEKINLILN